MIYTPKKEKKKTPNKLYKPLIKKKKTHKD